MNTVDMKKKVMEYLDVDLRSTLVYAVAGVILGYTSFIINQPKISIILSLTVILALRVLIKTVWKIKQPPKWWLGNGIIIYIFIWLIVWTIFYNIRLLG